MPKEDPDQFWLNAEELPGNGNIYGGLIKLPDGRTASVYMQMGKDDIEILEVNVANVQITTISGMEKAEIFITDIVLTREELDEVVKIGDRQMTVQRHIFEQIIPYYYNRKKRAR